MADNDTPEQDTPPARAPNDREAVISDVQNALYGYSNSARNLSDILPRLLDLFGQDDDDDTGGEDTLPVVSIASVTTPVSEGETAQMTLRLSKASTDAVKVNWTASGISATSEDFKADSGSVVWVAGSTDNAVINVQTYSDAVAGEGDETFRITLDSATGATIDSSSKSRTVVITDVTEEVTLPEVSIKNVTTPVDEGEVCTVVFSIDKAPQSSPVSLQWSTVPGSATSDEDYEGSQGVLTWDVGSSGDLSVELRVYGDLITDEDGETFKVGITAVSGATINESARERTVTITDKTVEEPDYKWPSIVIGSQSGDVARILSKVPASKAQQQVQMTPADILHGHVLTGNIETGPDGDADRISTLRTMLRQGKQVNGQWQWDTVLVTPRTIQDKWHAAPSVAYDNDGYVHVATDMHNFPWQYYRSTEPHDINTLEFRGQYMSQAEIDRHVLENRTSFPDHGIADIPGNQVTYPRFCRDRNGELYVSYRFAARPNRKFSERMMSTGIARYNTRTKTWFPIGAKLTMNAGDYVSRSGAPNQPTVFAGADGWTSYQPRLMFDQDNRLWVNIFWRSGIAGSHLSRPSCFYVQDNVPYAPDGRRLSFPLRPEDSDGQIIPNSNSLYTIGNVAISPAGVPHVLLSHHEPASGRKIYRYEGGQWRVEDSPSNCSDIFFAPNGDLFAMRQGPKIFRRPANSSSWSQIYDAGVGDNFPRGFVDEHGDNAVIHCHGSNYLHCSTYAMRLWK